MPFRYQKEGSEVLDGISLALYPGEIYALTGRMAAGKSTTLQIALQAVAALIWETFV